MVEFSVPKTVSFFKRKNSVFCQLTKQEQLPLDRDERGEPVLRATRGA